MLGLLMVTVLIVVGVIAFLAVDAYILYRVFAGRRSAGDYATLPVPGEASVTLEIKGPGFRGMGESLDTGSGWSRALVGTIEVVEAGPHTITARGDLPDAIEPQILDGR